jgi:fructokinase
MTPRFTIVGIGECLFDVFGGEYRIGGAPLNVAGHAHQLGRPVEGRGVLVSRVGQDELGRRLIDHLREAGMETGYLQTDPDRATGRVFVRLDDQGRPDYDIVQDAAWDMIWFDPEDEDLAMTCDGVCFGSLAQRDAQARNAIYRFLNATRHGTQLFDANLRQKFYDQRILRRSCELANVVKVNTEELPILARELSLDEDDQTDATAGRLLRKFDLKMVVLTRGQDGTRLYLPDQIVDGAPAHYDAAENADPVGAGDACAAAILVGLALRMKPQAIADLANHCGAYVASQPGANPTLPEDILQMVG